jgi:predicted nucleic acid-binding protein
LSDRKVVFINTGPLIAFTRAGYLHTLRALPMRLFITREVERELKEGETAGLPPVDLTGFERIKVPAVGQELSEELDDGEASVLQAALDHGDAWVAIDEEPARMAAEELRIPLRGTLGLLLEAKQLGLVEAVGPIVDLMRSSGSWFSDRLVANVLKRAGENPGP